MSLSRRSFVKTAAVAGAGVALPLGINARVRGANDDLRVAVIGLNGRGWNLIDWVMGDADEPRSGVRLVAICDVDQKVLADQAKKFEKNYPKGGKLQTYTDFREVIENKDIDAVVVATPNHWHSLMSIMAIQAGKDVYCEKPVSHNVWEGRQLVNAARKYNKIVQTGTQSRSSPSLKQAVEFVNSGQLGKIEYVVGTCYKPRKPIGKLAKPLEIPEHINYDLWCGPAAKVELMRPRLHYDWHWDFNTGNGDLGNQGIHQMDIARWFLGVNELSPRVVAIGGRFMFDDAADTPNTELVLHDYDKAPLYFDTRGLPRSKEYTEGEKEKQWNQMMDDAPGGRIGVYVKCEGGAMQVPSYSSAKAVDNNGKTIKPFSGGGDHMGNFFDAVRSRKPSDLNAEIVEGHLSSALCHTGNISYQLGKQMSTDEAREAFKGNAAAQEVVGKFLDHCKANGVDLSDKALTVGPWLEMDPRSETFKNNAQANKLLTREYRKPFVVPAINPVA